MNDNSKCNQGRGIALWNIAPARSAVIATLMALILMILSGCERSNTMGKLRAQWQVTSIEYENGDIVSDFSPRLYYCFDQDILMLTDSDDSTMALKWYIGMVKGQHPDYTLEFPYDAESWALPKIKPWGIEEAYSDMHILRLDNKSLVMRIGKNVITCRRF